MTRSLTPYHPSPMTRSLTPYHPAPMTVVLQKGSLITAQRGDYKVTRNSTYFKRAPRHPATDENEAGTRYANHDDDSVRNDKQHSHTPEPATHSAPPDQNTTLAPNNPNQALRRSTRTTQVPHKFHDFVLS
ncbi:hypothetical protein ACOMHN_025994 [Nucella lapillus]